MSYRSFKKWLFQEYKDIFGFERERDDSKKAAKDPRDQLPIHRIDIEYITTKLAETPIGVRKGRQIFVNQVQWGDGPGALAIKIEPDLHVEFKRFGRDLTGDSVWATKKLVFINRTGFGGHEDHVIEEIIDDMKIIDEQPLDSPKKDYEELENLVSSIASAFKRSARSIFIFEGIRKVDDANYIIRLGVRGHGVETQDQQRVEENQTQVTFNKDTGVIRIINYNVESSVGHAHEWALMQMDNNNYYFPTQSKDEIVETIATSLRWY